MQWQLILLGWFTLLTASYLDNVRGPLLPVISKTLGIPYLTTSLFLVFGNLAAVVATLLLLPIRRRLSLKTFSLAIYVFAFASVWVSAFVTNQPTLLVLGALLGVSISILGALSNLLIIEGTTENYRSRFFCGLHAMYGLASFAAPFVVTLVLQRHGSWNLPFTLSSIFLFVLATQSQLFRPARQQESREAPSFLFPKGGGLVLFVFSVYVAAECLISMWMVTYLIEARALLIDVATRFLSLYFLTMTLTRLLCFWSMTEKVEFYLLCGSLILATIGFGLGLSGVTMGFAMAGALGPFFPIFLGRMSREFRDAAPHLTLWMLASVQLAVAVTHLVVGVLTDTIGIEKSYFLPIALLCVSFIGLLACHYQRFIFNVPREIQS